MSSPTFNVSITSEEIGSMLEGWTDQITKVGSVEDMRCIKQDSRKLTSLSKLMNFKASCCLAELSHEKKFQFINKGIFIAPFVLSRSSREKWGSAWIAKNCCATSVSRNIVLVKRSQSAMTV
eukprot:6997423-Ditylum_brightwellii.AAC.1